MMIQPNTRWPYKYPIDTQASHMYEGVALHVKHDDRTIHVRKLMTPKFEVVCKREGLPL